MNNMITDSGDVVYYVVRVNGVEVSKRFNARMMAEMAMHDLPAEQNVSAEVVPITTNGDELLLG